MSITVDANVLVYASNPRDPAYDVARELLDRLVDGPDLLFLFWPVLMGYLRIVTRARILADPLSPEEAHGNIDWLTAPSHVRTPGEVGGFWPLYAATAGTTTRGNHVPDAHLATLMRQHGVGTIYTRDRGFRRFDGIRAVDPFS